MFFIILFDNIFIKLYNYYDGEDMKKNIIYVILILMIIPCNVYAKTLQDLYNELANIQSELAANKNNRSLTEKEVSNLQEEILNINRTIEKQKIEIEEAEKSIEESEASIIEKGKQTDELLKFLQVTTGENKYLEYLFEAEDYTDFIYRYEVVKQLSDYNSNLINELEALIIELEQKEKDLDEKNKELETERKSLSSKLNTLRYNLTSFDKEGATLEDDIANMQRQIKAYEDMGCKKDQDLDKCTATINAYGWKVPISKGCVTSNYGWRTFWLNGRWVTDYHYGMDLSCISEGSPVYAAANGVVYNMVHKGSCGGNMVYIRHTVNGKKYTTVYMHLLKFGDIKLNSVVTDSTVIGYVGGSSTRSYDRCTSGTHLHFGMASGWPSYGFESYTFDPRKIFNFPAEGSGYFYR